MRRQQDLPLKKDIAARFIPKIVALMVYLGTLCFVFTLVLIHATHSWENQLTSHLSIEIPAMSEGTVPSEALQAKVLSLLNRTPGIKHAAAVSQKEMGMLVQALLGEATADFLSLPTIIDVTLNGEEPIDLATLETHLKNISPVVQVMDHRPWQRQVLTLIQASVLIACTLTFLIICGAFMTTTFATRTSLLIHRQIIDVLNLMGATPSYIAAQFQINALKQGLVAGVLGSSVGFLTCLGIIFLLEHDAFPFLFQSSFFIQSLCIFALAPGVTALFMMLAARLAVMKELRP